MLADRDIFLALLAGLMGLILLAIVGVFFRKRHLKQLREKARTAKGGMVEV